MDQPASVEIVGKRGFYRPAGAMTLEQAVQDCGEAISIACQRRLTELVLDTRQLVGFETPDVFDRFFMVTDWTQIAGGVPIRIAFVARSQHIDRRKFGVTVATNRGLLVDVFADEEAAIAWLDGASRSSSA
ncbi:MAG: hypothetical protein JSS27_17685 [Planctomycetes bacterium]|nr:hypothetical protein [Planctomycetota bacterium]